MKKFCITFLLSGIIILSAIGFGTGILGSGSTANTNTEYLRIHIRANSNDGEDQAVKYMVRDAVVDYLTPFVAEAETKEEAMSLMNGQLSRIAQVADGVLRAHGFTYGARAELKDEEFPNIRWKRASIRRLSSTWGRVREIIGGASSIRPSASRDSPERISSIRARSRKSSTAGNPDVEQSFPSERLGQADSSRLCVNKSFALLARKKKGGKGKRCFRPPLAFTPCALMR